MPADLQPFASVESPFPPLRRIINRSIKKLAYRALQLSPPSYVKSMVTSCLPPCLSFANSSLDPSSFITKASIAEHSILIYLLKKNDPSTCLIIFMPNGRVTEWNLLKINEIAYQDSRAWWKIQVVVLFQLNKWMGTVYTWYVICIFWFSIRNHKHMNPFIILCHVINISIWQDNHLHAKLSIPISVVFFLQIYLKKCLLSILWAQHDFSSLVKRSIECLKVRSISI